MRKIKVLDLPKEINIELSVLEVLNPHCKIAELSR
jgi:hypothetical protein